MAEDLRTLPDLSKLESLEVLRVSNCRVLKNLSPLLAAPALRLVAVSRMSHLTADDLVFLADHPNGPRLRVRLGTLERTAEALSALGAQGVAEGRPAGGADLPTLPQGCWALPPPAGRDCLG